MDTTTTSMPPAAATGEGRIAITSLKKDGWMRLPSEYVSVIAAAGASSKVVSTFPTPPEQPAPVEVDLEADLDPGDATPLGDATGLVLTGGGDVDPELYGRPRHAKTRNVARRRDLFELGLVRHALERDLPVLAICRGMQLLNVALGGTLVQHLADDPRRLDHDRDRPRPEYAHQLGTRDGSLIADVLGAETLPVNSRHHQGLDEVAEPLEEVAWAEDGVLEAVVSREHSWVVGVQWHPEVMAPIDERQMRVFEAFVGAARRFEAKAGARS